MGLQLGLLCVVARAASCCRCFNRQLFSCKPRLLALRGPGLFTLLLSSHLLFVDGNEYPRTRYNKSVEQQTRYVVQQIR